MRRTRNRNIIIAAAVALSLIVVGRVGGLKPVTVTLDYLTAPIRDGLRGVGSHLGGLDSDLIGVRHLQSDNARLQQQVADLRQEVAQDTEIKQQNTILRSQLQIGGGVTSHLVAADVIGYQPDNFRQFLTISRGSNDGLKTGQAVVAAGELVGVLSDVSRTTAKVFLVTDPNFKTNGIDQASRATGTVQGQLGTGLEMTKIAQGDAVAPGDTVITSGLGGDLPKGIIIGQIQSVDQRDNQVFQTAQINTQINIAKLELVFVVAS